MWIIQAKDTFIRTAEKIGYIYNQKTKYERLYNETGVDYLKAISRFPQKISFIVESILLPLYSDVSYEVLNADFKAFLKDLEIKGFVFIGEKIEELEEKETAFYSNYKINNEGQFAQSAGEEVGSNIQETIMDFTGENPYLMSLQFELTSKCNERCIHCYIPNDKKDSGINLPFNLFQKAIDEFYEMGGLQVSLSGGEIFMHQDITRMIKYCREKDMQIILLSNLIALDNDLMAIIKDANISMIQASLYSMDQEIHDTITKVKGSYNKTREAIELLVANDIPVMISCPIIKANADSYHDILEYAHSLGIKAQTDFILMGEEDLNTANLKHRISLKDTEKIIREILHNEGVDSIDILKDPTPFEAFPLKLSQPVCAAGRTNICINANGDVTPCNGWQGMKAGNIYHSSLSDIWLNSNVLTELRHITRGSFKKCTNCDAKDFCSLCMARNYNESNGDYFKINPHFCDIAFLNKRIYEEIRVR